MYRAEGMADSVTQEQSSVEGRAELKAKAEELCFFFASLPVFPYLFLHESAFFFWGAVIENLSGLRPSGGGLRPKMGRSQHVKISPAEH